MVDAPGTIGLAAGPFGLRLWNREEDDSEAGVIRYLRADIAEAKCDRLVAEVARLRGMLLEARDFVNEASGAALGLAMSGSSHPDPDGVLMDLSRKGMDLASRLSAALARESTR